MNLAQMYTTNDFKLFYPKSALSSICKAGCGLKPEDEDQDNTKLSSTKRTAIKTSYVLPNGVRYSISKPIFNSKRGKKNG
jgi:hypothetical protein